MIDLLFAKTARGATDVALGDAIERRRDAPQPVDAGSGDRHLDTVARIVGSTVADPLTRMQFEFRATARRRLFAADAHEAAARRFPTPDFIPDHVGLAAWTPALSMQAAGNVVVAGAEWLHAPAGLPLVLGVVHGAW